MKTGRLTLLTLAASALATVASAAEKELTLGSPKSNTYGKLAGTKKGGTANRALLGNPKYLNALLSMDTNSGDVFRFLDTPLMVQDSETLEWLPALALTVTISADKKTYTYKLNPEATWSDGSPFTSEDIVFSHAKLMDTKTDAAPIRAYYEGVKVKALDKHTVQFTLDTPKFNTLESLNGYSIVSKKQFANEPDFNKAKGTMEPLSTGPYRFKSFTRDQSVIIERRKDWWGYKYAHNKDQWNADVINFRIIPDMNVQYEKFLNHDVDALGLRAEQMGLKVRGVDKAKFETNPNAKTTKNRAFEINNNAPRPWTYMAWNLRNPLFKSVKTRQALAHLVDYKQMLQKVYFGFYIQSTSPFGSLSNNSDPELRKPGKMISFDRKKALKLLREDGWNDSNGDNILDRMVNGKRVDFKFTLKTNSNNSMRVKLAQVLKESFKSAGINITVQSVEANAFWDDKDARRFDALIAGYGGTQSPDPKQIWHTDSEKNQGSNASAYSNPKVDGLIAQANTEFDPSKRAKIMQEINGILYEDQPFVFLAEEKAYLLGVTPKVSAKTWGFKYSPGTYMRDEWYSFASE